MRLLKVREAASISGLSSSTLNNRRYDGTLIENVHYIVKGPNVVLYCEEEFTHWARYGHTEYHQKWLVDRAKELAKESKRR